MTIKHLADIRRKYLDTYYPYKMLYWEQFNYKVLDNIIYRKRAGRGSNETVNEVFIMADTETSKKPKKELYIDETYYEIKNDIVKKTFKKLKIYSEVANFSLLRRAGIKLSYNTTYTIDSYYEELRELYPWIFTQEAFSDIQALEYIYNYLSNEPELPKEVTDNHVAAWTISLRAFNRNIVTLWGRKPSDLAKCITKIIGNMNGYETIIYWHNMPYDWVFIRKFMFEEFGYPEKQLNVKSHYPILIQWDNGLTFKDSLILAQRSLEKWAKDLQVEHQKAVGFWDYDKIRHQNDEPFTTEELEYIEHDTLAGVECLDKMRITLNKSVYSMPYTATGIPREDIRKIGKEFNARDQYKRMCLTYNQYIKAECVYHGGYTHANRHLIDTLIEDTVKCYDFASSYPFVMLSEKYPMEAFTPLFDKNINYILENADNYAFMFKLILINVRLKDDFVSMPALQFSKCINTINAICDNGRILKADYVEIYLSEMDLKVITEQYKFDKHICSEVEVATKDYLPRWFTDYIFKLFTDKTNLKGGDPVLYALKKAKLNSLYGMCVQKNIKDEITEVYSTGEYNETQADAEELYNKFIGKRNTILPYQWGVWVTAYAFYNLFQLGKCCETWVYSDTDSCYGINWDENKLNAYNNLCKDKLRSNGYGAVIYNNREYWLGVAEFDNSYTQYKVMGAKRYCGRSVEDNELHITVAGVPKKLGAKCLKDDINKFTKGFIFKGTDTGKLTHTYNYIEDIYIDEYGNETGDSIDLTPCDYKLDSVNVVDWDALLTEEIEVQTYEE